MSSTVFIPRSALREIERLWGAKSGTRDGDRLDVLATLIEAYETAHYPIDPPDPIEAIRFRMDQQGLTRKDLDNTSLASGFDDAFDVAVVVDRRIVHNKHVFGGAARCDLRPRVARTGVRVLE